MKRRNFIQTGALSIVGWSSHTKVLGFLKQAPDGIHGWLQHFTTVVNARRQTSTLFQSPQLQEQIDQTDRFMALRGFHREQSGAFFSENGQTCFYPLLLRCATANLNEMLVPVFHRQADGRWKRLVVLTAYQMEALCSAATELTKEGLPLHELLLPAGSTPAVDATFVTQRGTVSVETTLQQAGAQTTVTVKQAQAVIYSAVFRSKHNLTHQV